MDWLDKLFNYGVPTVLLFVTVYGATRVARWLKPRLEKAFDLHFALVETLTTHLEQQTDELKKQTSILRKIEETGCGYSVQTGPRSHEAATHARLQPEIG